MSQMHPSDVYCLQPAWQQVLDINYQQPSAKLVVSVAHVKNVLMPAFPERSLPWPAEAIRRSCTHGGAVSPLQHVIVTV